METLRQKIEYAKDEVRVLKDEGIENSELDNILSYLDDIESSVGDIETLNNEVKSVVEDLENSSHMSGITEEIRPHIDKIGEIVY